MSKHTLGPYEAHTRVPNWYGMEARFFEVTDASGHIVAFVKEWSDAPEEYRANTNLFAAAPELLEALTRLKIEIVLSDIDPDYIESHFRTWLNKAEEAIAKATGS